LTYLPGNSAGTISAGAIYNIIGAMSGLQTVQGTFKNLAIGWSSNSLVGITADSLALTSSVPSSIVLTAISASLNTASSGANGLDTGSLAASTWYYIFVIYNNTTVASLMSLSPTAPTLPGGYTYFARVGSLWIDDSSNIRGFKQLGRDVQYVVGNNLTALPSITSGSQGNISIPTWAAASLANFVPRTAAKIRLFLAAFTNGTFSIAAPNNSYGALGSTSNSPPLVSPANGGVSVPIQGELVLESTSVYYASSDASGILQCIGYTDNI